MLTNKGERYLQPDIGLNLRKFLFEQITDDIQETIKIEIVETLDKWLPFVNVEELNINAEEDSTDTNTLKIFVLFNIKNNPNILESVSVEITGE